MVQTSQQTENHRKNLWGTGKKPAVKEENTTDGTKPLDPMQMTKFNRQTLKMDYAMYPHYDTKGAAAELAVLSEKRTISPHSQLQLARMFHDEGNPYRAEKDGGIWRLVFNTAGHTAPEEVVASIQGILCKFELPPFLNQIGTNSRNTRFLKQSVKVTGYGNESFEKLATDIARIRAIFKRAVGRELQDEGGTSQKDGFTTIDASNPYFSLRGRNQGDECAITDDMDPKGYLRKARHSSYIL